jgi:hypothetical protein
MLKLGKDMLIVRGVTTIIIIRHNLVTIVIANRDSKILRILPLIPEVNRGI